MFNQPELKGDFGPYGVFGVALIFTMAVTAAVMIARDSFLWLLSRLRRPLSETNEANDGANRAYPGIGRSEPRKLPAGRWVSKEPR